MKEDLKRLMKEFLEESYDYRTEIIEVQNTKDSPITKKKKTRQPTLLDFIEWLNRDF